MKKFLIILLVVAVIVLMVWGIKKMNAQKKELAQLKLSTDKTAVAGVNTEAINGVRLNVVNGLTTTNTDGEIVPILTVAEIDALSVLAIEKSILIAD